MILSRLLTLAFILFLPTLVIAIESEYSHISFNITELGTLGGRNSKAKSVNNNGQVVGSSNTSDGIHATLWDNGQIIDLGTFEGKVIKNGQITEGHSIANGINDNGQVVGYSTYLPPSNEHAAIWINDKITDLTGSFDFRVANSINANGKVVGYSVTYTKSLGYPKAVLWNNGTHTNLNPKEATASLANSINAIGQVAGYIVYGGYPRHATVWNNGILDFTRFSRRLLTSTL